MALTARDTTRDIRDTVKDVEKSGVVSDTAGAMDEQPAAGAETAREQKVQHYSYQKERQRLGGM